MKTLYLLRHAKSDWQAAVDDKDRELNYNGELEDRKLGKDIKARNIKFDKIICSPAVRAVQTYNIVSKSCGYQGEVFFSDKFYFCRAEEILEIVGTTDDAVDSLLLVGHNPVWSDLVHDLSDEHPRIYLDTCNFAALTFDGRWSDLSAGKNCKLDYVISPRNI